MPIEKLETHLKLFDSNEPKVIRLLHPDFDCTHIKIDKEYVLDEAIENTEYPFNKPISASKDFADLDKHFAAINDCLKGKYSFWMEGEARLIT